jgi:hypothetical protein
MKVLKIKRAVLASITCLAAVMLPEVVLGVDMQTNLGSIEITPDTNSSIGDIGSDPDTTALLFEGTNNGTIIVLKDSHTSGYPDTGTLIIGDPSSTHSYLQPLAASFGGQVEVVTSVDIKGSEGLILENSETITNSTNGTVLINGDVAAGTGSAAGVFKSNGDQDVVLKTGSSTTGSIRIKDGANGNITITPNGTGEVDISKVDIDGGAIDGTAIGANSASSGSFTTLAASGATTLSSTLAVTGTSTFTGASTFENNVTVEKDLHVDGDVYISGMNVKDSINRSKRAIAMNTALASLQIDSSRHSVSVAYGHNNGQQAMALGLNIKYPDKPLFLTLSGATSLGKSNEFAGGASVTFGF